MQHGSRGSRVDPDSLVSRHGMSYQVQGNAPETIVLVHGVGSSAATWWRLCPLLADSYRLVSYDLRGHGGSAKRPVPWSMEDFVSDHLQLMGELGIARHHLVGFSLGALIAISVTIKAPEAVDRLVLLNCASDRQEEDRRRIANRMAQVRASNAAKVARDSTTRWFTEAFLASHPEVVDQEVAIVSATDDEMYKAAYEVLATTDQRDEAHQVTRPVLLVTGENDAGSTPRMSVSLAERFPDSAVQVLPRLKHYLHVEAPGTVAELIEGFLSAARAS